LFLKDRRSPSAKTIKISSRFWNRSFLIIVCNVNYYIGTIAHDPRLTPRAVPVDKPQLHKVTNKKLKQKKIGDCLVCFWPSVSSTLVSPEAVWQK